jgi:hypothetical protein
MERHERQEPDEDGGAAKQAQNIEMISNPSHATSIDGAHAKAHPTPLRAGREADSTEDRPDETYRSGRAQSKIESRDRVI